MTGPSHDAPPADDAGTSAITPDVGPLPTPPAPSARAKWLRVGALVLLTIVLLAIGHATGLTDSLTRERLEALQALMLELGALGFLAYLAIFAIGELMHVPGMLFVVAAILAYGPAAGSAAALAGAFVSLTASFFVVRVIGGQPLGDVQRPIVRRVLERLDRRPVATIAVLRLIFSLAPALNYGLAMSKVRYRHYIAGSALGLTPWIAAAALFVDWFVAWLFS